MKRLLFFPFNVILVMMIGFFLSIFHFSQYYTPPDLFDFFWLVLSLLPQLVFGYVFYNKFKVNFPLSKSINLNKISVSFLIIGLMLFLVVFFRVGIPIFSSTGRDIYTADDDGKVFGGDSLASLLNMIGYSCVLLSVTFSSAFNSKKIALLCLGCVVLLSVLILSRQLTMISVVIYAIFYFVKNKINKKLFFRTILFIVFVVLFFSVLGNFRQEAHGDYVTNYAHFIGASTKEGYLIGDSLFWFWLYISSPVYNLFYNLHTYREATSLCYALSPSCIYNFLTADILPSTISKAFGWSLFPENLVAQHLNVSTAFTRTVMLFGYFGAFIHSLMQVFFYLLFYICCQREMRFVMSVYYSALTFFSVFFNIFIGPSFVFVLVVIIAISWINKFKYNF